MIDTINIARDYTPVPAGRYPEDGPGNGTTFRERFLVPVVKAKQKAIVVLDGAAGYPSSFLEEAFGGLVREHHFSPDEVLSSFKFVATQPGFGRFVMLIEDFVATAAAQSRGTDGPRKSA